LIDGVRPSRINHQNYIHYNLYKRSYPDVPPPRVVTVDWIRKLRQFFLPTLVAILCGYLSSRPEDDGADIHSDAYTHAQVHCGATLLNIKRGNESRRVALGIYQLGSGTAVDGARGHLECLSYHRELLAEVQSALSDSSRAFEVDRSHLLINFFSSFVRDHNKTEVAVVKLLNEERTLTDDAALVEVGCSMHKLTNLEDDALKGESVWLKSLSRAHAAASAPVMINNFESLTESQQLEQLDALTARIDKDMPDVSMTIRAIGKQFGAGLDPYAKGQGLTFGVWLATTEGLQQVHQLLRMVGSRNHVYWENALMVYFFIEYYVGFLVDERKVRWGAAQATELNRLQHDLLSQLTCLPLKIALRGRAQWFYSVWDPLRYISGSQKLSVIEMGKVWRLLGELIDDIALDGSILEDRTRCESFFLDLVPDVAEWRAKKMERARYSLPVERIYEIDETDVLMASYHSHTAEGQKVKFLAMCADYLEG
jgi:hypothetical protein